MINIKSRFHDLSIKRKFYFSFGFIFLIVFLSSSYFYYIFYEINQYTAVEESISKINFSVDALITSSLENTVYLNEYNDRYDYPLISKMEKNRDRILDEIKKLKKITKIQEVNSKLTLYESFLEKKEILRKKIISMVNYNENLEKINLLRHQRQLLDSESISYLNRIKEIEKTNLENIKEQNNFAKNKLKVTFFFIVIFLFLSLLLISLFISKIIISDINLIDKFVKDISNGDFSSKINEIHKDELGDLAKFLNVMTGKLQVAKETMSKITRDLNLKIAEGEKAESLLENQTLELERIAYYDVITGLPNKVLFEKLLSSFIEKYSKNKKIALFFLNIKNFKSINETLGHHYGDQILKEVANRLLENKKEEEIISRFAGDEFILVKLDRNGDMYFEKEADILLSIFAKPFFLKNYMISISINIGIAIYPESGKTIDELVKNAGSALYKARELEQEKVFFIESLSEEKKELLKIESILRKSIEEKKFHLNFQPIVKKDKSLYGVEVLLRWEPFLFPAGLTNEEIIPLAEKVGLIIPLGNAIVESALRQYAIWKQKKYSVKMSINLSTKQVIQKDFLKWIEGLFSFFEIDPGCVSFEITETAIVRDIVLTKNNLQHLRNLGCGVLIDDFGTGYASMNLIKKLPITGIKIDKSYIQKELHEPKNLAVLKMMIAFSESMDFDVIIEGIETEEQFEFISSLAPGQKIQGLYTSKALSADEIEKWFIVN